MRVHLALAGLLAIFANLGWAACLEAAPSPNPHRPSMRIPPSIDPALLSEGQEVYLGEGCLPRTRSFRLAFVDVVQSDDGFPDYQHSILFPQVWFTTPGP